jgi:hypothetical protein
MIVAVACGAKGLENLSCMWCKSYNAHLSLSEKTDHMISDMSRTIIPPSNNDFSTKFHQTMKASKRREEHHSGRITKRIGVDGRLLIRFQDQISSETTIMLSDIIFNR